LDKRGSAKAIVAFVLLSFGYWVSGRVFDLLENVVEHAIGQVTVPMVSSETIVLGLFGIVAIVLGAGLLLTELWPKRKPESQSTLILGERPDPRLDHIRVHVFSLPFCSKTIKRQDDFPRKKYAVNNLTHKALSVGDNVWPLLVPYRRIEINPETICFPFYRRYWAWRQHLTIVHDKAKVSDLLEGTTLTSLNPIEPITLTEETAEPVERMYDLATLRLDVETTTDWIEIGLLDSRSVSIRSRTPKRTILKPVDDSNLSHLRIDSPDAKFSVTATFEVYSGPLFVFTRKGDIGTLKVNIFNKNGKPLFEISEYGTTTQKYNHKETAFEFNDWD
jgi:hypothetical protein